MALRADDIDLDGDRALVEAWQAGDDAAFDALYTRHFDRLRSYCQRRVGDRVDAEEIAQEAFAKALQALPRFSGERRFYPWMTVIAARLCVDHHRRRARVEPTDEIDAGHVDDGHDERITMRADLAALDRALHRLGPRHREVLDLRERDGLSYHQIADTLSVPHSTVEALLFRARRALRKEFERVSLERLAGVPVIAWLLDRANRVRARIAQSGVELAALGAPLAAGAVTVLMALPTTAAAPTVPGLRVAAARPLLPAAAVVTPADPGVPPPAAAPASSTARSAAPAPQAIPGVTPMSSQAARTESEQMPLSVELGDLGVGLNLDPVTTRLVPQVGRTTP